MSVTKLIKINLINKLKTCICEKSYASQKHEHPHSISEHRLLITCMISTSVIDSLGTEDATFVRDLNISGKREVKKATRKHAHNEDLSSHDDT